jgi:hypothetical protein
MGDGLRSTAAKTLNAWARLGGSGPTWSAWRALLHAVRTGQPAFNHVHGSSVWDARRASPENGELFMRAMREGRSTSHPRYCKHMTSRDVGASSDITAETECSSIKYLRSGLNLRCTLFDLPYAAAGQRDQSQAARNGIGFFFGNFLGCVPAG